MSSRLVQICGSITPVRYLRTYKFLRPHILECPLVSGFGVTRGSFHAVRQNDAI
jgi:hypothetical protein